MTDDLLTTAEAAEYLGGRDKQHIARLCIAGRLAAVKVPDRYGDSWRIDRGSLAEYKATRFRRRYRRRAQADPGWMTTWEAAEYLDLSPKTIGNFLRDHVLEAKRINGGRFWQVRVESLEQYKLRRENRPGRGGCVRCTLIAPLDEGGLCAICRDELDGRFLWYTQPMAVSCELRIARLTL